MKQQTAIDWLISELNNSGIEHLYLVEESIEQAKEMERQQIVFAHTNGQKHIIENVVCIVFPNHDFSNTKEEINKALSGIDNDESAEQYYNETFGSQKEGTD